MAVYSKPVRALMKEDMVAALASQPYSVFSRQDAVKWFAENYPKIKRATVSAHLVKFSTNAPGRIHHNVTPGDDDVLYQLDSKNFRLYDSKHDPPPVYLSTETKEGEDNEDDTQPTTGSEFAYEVDLRNYLVKNLSLIESGLRLYEENEIRGIEFPVGNRRIDILARDTKGGLVVIELKVSRGYDKVVGQLLRYVAWIRKNLAEDSQKVRGVIVARQMTEDLLLACSSLPDIELFEYELSLSLRRIDNGNA